MSGADPPAGSRAESVVGGLAPTPEIESFFVFGYPKRAFFTSQTTHISSDVRLTGHSDSQ